MSKESIAPVDCHCLPEAGLILNVVRSLRERGSEEAKDLRATSGSKPLYMLSVIQHDLYCIANIYLLHVYTYTRVCIFRKREYSIREIKYIDQLYVYHRKR